MKKAILFTGLLLFCSNYVFASAYEPQVMTSEVFVETPVQSYYAYPDDPNFIPETEFMDMGDDIDYDEMIENVRYEEADFNPGVQFTERPTVICRDFNCTRLNDRITRTFLFNSLATMFLTNAHSRLYICEADPFSRSCLQSGISFPVRSGIANALVKIPKATISQVNLSTGLSRATVSMTYEMLVNGIQRSCEPTVMDIAVPNNSQATLLNREFACKLTSNGMSNVSLLLNIDYIDLDYGLIGGYYSLGMQGPTMGSASGYLVFKTEFTTNGMKFRASTYKNADNIDNPGVSVRPGEYTVEALN
ncbi:MAG: hypothetical protein IKN73_02040 [Alphaproteobacteria bacterium]|nr:hypothetical protein [Alphaproteobacteria bacterium]